MERLAGQRQVGFAEGFVLGGVGVHQLCHILRVGFPVHDQLGLAHLPSHANFVMHRIRGELTEYNRRMLDTGFRVGRPFPPMLDHSRVSLGLPEDMERFAEALRGFRARAWV